jgi:hypothetical protein
MADYVDDYRRRGGKGSDSVESVARRNILPELGSLSVVKLTTRPWYLSSAPEGIAVRLVSKIQDREGGSNRPTSQIRQLHSLG